MTEYSDWKSSEALKWLRHVRWLYSEQRAIKDTIAAYADIAQPHGIDYSLVCVMSSVNKDAIVDAITRIATLCDEWTTKLNMLESEIREAQRCISKIDDARYRCVLHSYYIARNTWDAVADELCYSADYCRQLRDESLPFVYDVMPVEYKTRIPSAGL